jgi:hypothetical protein
VIPEGFYRPVQVAEMLHCSEWWVKEQARRRRIPYAWIGGNYLFTAEHIAEVIRRFEVHPADELGLRRVSSPRRTAHAEDASIVRLQPRPPRRVRHAGTQDSSAA